MEYVIGVDLGTSSCKVLALTSDGVVLGQANDDYPLYTTGEPGQAVQRAEDVWRAVQAMILQLGERLDLQQASGVSLSGAMHSLLPVTRRGQPLAPAMTWADNRAAAQAAAIRQKVNEQALYQRTGCPVQAIYLPARLRWWQEQGAPPGTEIYAGLKEWVLHRLTGEWAFDRTMASTTGLLDIHQLWWDEEALSLSGIKEEQLPRLVDSTEQAGQISREAAAATGLRAGLPVFAGSHDGGTANLGAGSSEPGEVAITVGTSGAIRVVVDKPWLDAERRTWCYLFAEKRWLAGGAINNGGLATGWVREQFYRDAAEKWEDRVEKLMAEAETVPPGAEGVLVLPYFSGERTPHWDVDGSATIHGLRLDHSRAHVARAVLEGVAFCLADVWEVLQEVVGPLERPHPIRLSGGITRSPVWVQIVADVLGVPIRPADRADASAIGAALVGLYGLGMIERLEAQTDERGGLVYRPSPETHALYKAQHQMFQALYQAINT